MNEQQKLTLKMAILFLIVFVFCGVILVKEKFDILFIPKVEKKFTSYLEENYTSIDAQFKKSKITYENDVFSLKLSSKENKNHYFYITYSRKKIKDTYQKDYVEGASILNYIKTKIKKDILEKTEEDTTIKINKKLNDFTKATQEKILTETDYLTSKIYIIEKEITTNKWNSSTITKYISSFITNLEDNDITPLSYTIIISNENDLSYSIQINNLTPEVIKDNSLQQIIKDILDKKNSNLLEKYSITFKYLD